MLKKILLVLFLIFCLAYVLLIIKKIRKNPQEMVFNKGNSTEEVREYLGNLKAEKIDKDKNYEYVSGDYEFSLEHGGLTRKYLVHLPSQYESIEKAPVILAFHGGFGNMKDSPFYFELNPKADKEGFIVVYPEGTGLMILGRLYGSWNAWDCCNPAKKNNVDDIGFVRKIIEKIEDDFRIDSSRIYATGMSNGSQLSYRISCDLSDKIAAIAPVSSMTYSLQCNNKKSVPIIAFHGTADKCSRWEGGVCGGCSNDFVRSLGVKNIDFETRECLSVEDYLELWRKRNGCSNEREVFYQNKTAICYAYKNCNEDISFCKIEGMGHAWPGRKTPSSLACKSNSDGILCDKWVEIVEGQPNIDLSANDMMWDFFKSHPKK